MAPATVLVDRCLCNFDVFSDSNPSIAMLWHFKTHCFARQKSLFCIVKQALSQCRNTPVVYSSIYNKVLMARNADGKTGQKDLYKTVKNK